MVRSDNGPLSTKLQISDFSTEEETFMTFWTFVLDMSESEDAIANVGRFVLRHLQNRDFAGLSPRMLRKNAAAAQNVHRLQSPRDHVCSQQKIRPSSAFITLIYTAAAELMGLETRVAITSNTL